MAVKTVHLREPNEVMYEASVKDNTLLSFTSELLGEVQAQL